VLTGASVSFWVGTESDLGEYVVVFMMTLIWFGFFFNPGGKKRVNWEFLLPALFFTSFSLWIAFLWFTQPVQVTVSNDSIWTENRLKNVTSNSLQWKDLSHVYVTRKELLRGSYEYISIEDKIGGKIQIGNSHSLFDLYPPRDQLTAWLKARGVEVSNDRPPLKP
jgi:hypothetical protein